MIIIPIMEKIENINLAHNFFKSCSSQFDMKVSNEDNNNSDKPNIPSAKSQDVPSDNSVSSVNPIDDNLDVEEEITLDEIPQDQRTSPEYDKLWNEKASFEVENFANSYGLKRKWTDVAWSVLFCINLIITIVLFFLSKPWESETFSTEKGDISSRDMVIIGLIAIGISFVFSFLTYMFITIAPRPYVLCSLLICIIVILAFGIPIAIIASYYYFIIIFFSLFICLFTSCCMVGKLHFSADVMKSSAAIIRHYPSVILFNLVIFIIQSVLSYLFSVGAIVVYCRSISYAIYIYIILSYFWIAQTINSVGYTTVAGLASTWYFLNGTEHMPTFPLCTSLFHALGPSFGPCALAGMLEGISAAFDWIASKGEKLPCGVGSCSFSCFRCCCNCFVRIIGCIVGAIDRYSLIYCAMFGTPAKEGVKRWKIVAKKKIVDQVVNSCVVSTTFKLYAYSSLAVGSSIGGLLAKRIFEINSVPFLYLTVISAMCAFNGMELISKPIEVMSDTLFIGFAEAPLRLETGAKEIYDIFKGKAKKLLDDEINAAKGIKKPWWKKIFCCCN